MKRFWKALAAPLVVLVAMSSVYAMSPQIVQENDPTRAVYVQIINARRDTLSVTVRWPYGEYVLGKTPPMESRVYRLPYSLEDGTRLKLRITLGDGWSCITVGGVPAVGGEVITLRLYDGALAPAFCKPEKFADSDMQSKAA